MFMPFDHGVSKLIHSETLQSITTSKGEAEYFVSGPFRFFSECLRHMNLNVSLRQTLLMYHVTLNNSDRRMIMIEFLIEIDYVLYLFEYMFLYTKGKNLKYVSCCVCKIFSFYSRFVRFFMTLGKHLGIKLRLHNVDHSDSCVVFQLLYPDQWFLEKCFF